MLGLKLNHVSKRGPWGAVISREIYSNILNNDVLSPNSYSKPLIKVNKLWPPKKNKQTKKQKTKQKKQQQKHKNKTKQENITSIVLFSVSANGLAQVGNEPIRTLGLYSLSGRTSFGKISWSLEAARFVFRLLQSHWNFTGISATALPRCLPNFRAIRSL